MNFYQPDRVFEMEWYFSGRVLDSFVFLCWVGLCLSEDALFSKAFQLHLSGTL